MDSEEAIAALAALGQGTRLETFRRLIKSGPDGLPSSALADILGVPRNTMSNHLNVLSASGLIRSRRDGRQIIYRAEIERLASLTSFLVEGCCGGRTELCEPAITKIRPLDGT